MGLHLIMKRRDLENTLKFNFHNKEQISEQNREMGHTRIDDVCEGKNCSGRRSENVRAMEPYLNLFIFSS